MLFVITVHGGANRNNRGVFLAIAFQAFGLQVLLGFNLYGDNIHLEAVFDEAVVEGQIEIKGHVRAGTVIGLALKLVFKKEVRRLITQVKRLKKA